MAHKIVTENRLTNNLDALKGTVLIAMPKLSHSAFDHSLCYVCQHDEQGAVGLLINQPIAMGVTDLFEDQGLKVHPEFTYQPLLIGGPLQRERGFVLHQGRGPWRFSLQIKDDIYITTSQDILLAIAQKKAPAHYMVILGYSSWAPGQLEFEISQNHWLIAPANEALLFQLAYEQRWLSAIQSLGFNLAGLIEESGHA